MKSFTHVFSRNLLSLMSLLVLSLCLSAVPTPVAAAACVYTVNTTPFYPSGSGGQNTWIVGASNSDGSSCPWTAKSNVNWITVTFGASGVNAGSVIVNIQPNPNNFVRNGSLTIAGKVIYVYQAAACNYVVTPTQRNVIKEGGRYSVNLSTGLGCGWTFQSNVNWMRPVTSSGKNSDTIYFDVDPNSGGSRTGTLTLGGQTITVAQQPNCTYTLSITSQNVPSAGGTYTTQLTTAAGCSWELENPFSGWVKVNSVTNGIGGSATISYTVLANQGAARTGYLAIDDKKLTISQAAVQPTPTPTPTPTPQACTYTVSPASQNVPGGGGFYSANVVTTADCAWTAKSDSEAWVKITSAVGRFGNGPINYTVSPNTGAARTARITFADKQITITQEAGQPVPVPTLSAVNPGFVVAGAPSLTATVTGTNFTIGSKVRWNGENRATTFVGPTQLKVTLLDTDLKNAGTNKITIYESSTDKTSNTQTFLVLSQQASVSAASYKDEDIAPDSIVAAFGVKLANATAVASTVPLPPALAGTTVRVIDSKNLERRAPLFFVSPGQVNYLMPADMPMGPATVVITSESGDISVGYVNITLTAPGIFTAAANGAGHASALALRVKANGQQVYEPVVRYDQASQKFVAVPIDLTVPGESVFLVLYGTGMRYHGGLNAVSLKIGGTPASASYLGLSGLTGLDQLNAALPNSLIGRGEVDLVLTVDGKAANTVKLTFK